MTHLRGQSDMLRARDIMAKHLTTLSPDTPIPFAIHTLLNRRFSGMPVVDSDGQYLGMFTEKCCMQVLATLVELVDESWRQSPSASEVMIPRSRLFTLFPDDDVFVAISSLLRHRYSGAPVINREGEFLGVFSEKTCMSVVTEAAYNGLPTAHVQGFIDPDKHRLISADTELHAIAKIFIDTPYRRLPVMKDDRIVGQISRRDVLTDSRILNCIMKHHVQKSPMSRQQKSTESMVFLIAHDALPDQAVTAYADDVAMTISPELDLFSIAQQFLRTPYRRFPVVDDGRLIGQVSRCDVLKAAFDLLKQPAIDHVTPPLYISALSSSEEVVI